jgi:FKBP-type peptidyl-prolyl cis-trans isomerase SlyD
MSEFKDQEGYTNETLQPGRYIRYENKSESQSGLIIERKRNTIKVDFNHPLAGKDLYFKDHIVSVRNACFEEIEKQHHIEPDGIRFQ